MAVRRSDVARARSDITEVNWVLTLPVGSGGTSMSAWDACSEVEATAWSRPCWISFRAEKLDATAGSTPCWISFLAGTGTAELGSVAAVSIREASCPPVWLEASTTREARAPYPVSIEVR